MRYACGTGHFYGYRLVEAMGEDAERGVVRLSMAHYTSLDDVAAAIDALRRCALIAAFRNSALPLAQSR